MRRNLNIGSRLFDAGSVWACGVPHHLRGIYEIASSNGVLRSSANVHARYCISMRHRTGSDSPRPGRHLGKASTQNPTGASNALEAFRTGL